MTSLTNVLRVFDILKMPDGSDVTPQAVNDYFNRGAVRVSGGWASKGYYQNNVLWTSLNELSAEIARARPGTPQIAYIPSWGSGSQAELKAELAKGRPAILELFLRTPGYTGPHFIIASSLDGDRIGLPGLAAKLKRAAFPFNTVDRRSDWNKRSRWDVGIDDKC